MTLYIIAIFKAIVSIHFASLYPQVYVAAVLDRERQAEYRLTITATDGKFTANTTVTVTVIDVNGK